MSRNFAAVGGAAIGLWLTGNSCMGQALWVRFGTNGALSYYTDNVGNRLPDFSYAGYMSGGVALPIATVKVTISPVSGDNTANIQNAINAVSSLPAYGNGIRGAVLLRAGTYPVAGSLTINTGGVVLRGSGNDTNTGTVLLVTGTARNVLTLTGSSSWSQVGGTYNITDSYVPLGATNFHLSSASSFAVGNSIVVQRPQTQAWIDAIGMSNYWSPGTGLEFERRITSISGSQITIDVPLCNPIEQVWATGAVFQITDPARIQQVGVENLCAVGQISDYPSNILTGCFLVFANLRNGWAHDILLSGWGNGISLNGGCKWCTVQDCQYVDPATGTSSAAPAAYTIGDGDQMCLFQRCASSGGYYHIMVTQAGTAGPNVFLNFNSSGAHYNGGPHQRWAAGALHDNIVMGADTLGGYTPYLAINNRAGAGSGQGWGAGFSLMYNCRVPQFQLEQPSVTNHYNWTIGGIGSTKTYSDNGIYDTLGTNVSPQSLYLGQLRERLGNAALQNIGYNLFSVSASPAQQSLAAGAGTNYTVSVATNGFFNGSVTLSVEGLPPGGSAMFSPMSLGGAGSATLSVATSNSTPAGMFPLTVIGSDGNLSNSCSVTLTVTPGTKPPPRINSITISGTNLVVSGTSALAGTPYYVLTTTNLGAPLSIWTRLATNAFDASGNFSFTNALGVGVAQEFYALQVP